MRRVISLLLVAPILNLDDGIDGRLHRSTKNVDGYFVAIEESTLGGPGGQTIYLAQETRSGRRVLVELGCRERVDGSDGLVVSKDFIVAWYTMSTAEVQFASIIRREANIGRRSSIKFGRYSTNFVSPGAICKIDDAIFGMLDYSMLGFKHCLFRAEAGQVVVTRLDSNLFLVGAERGRLRFINTTTRKPVFVDPSNLPPRWQIVDNHARAVIE